MPDALLWTIAETAHQLGGISPRTVRRMVARGQLPAIRIGRCVRIPADGARHWVYTHLGTPTTPDTLRCPSTSAVKPGGWTSPAPAASDMELGGWSDPAMVRKYAHFSSAHLQEFAENVARKAGCG